jgi:single-stranded-DNA-specific exonuclease
MAVAQESKSRWLIGAPDSKLVQRVQQETGFGKLVAIALVKRGLVEPDAIERFLNPRLSDLLSPRDLPDYEPAKEAILGAKERGEKIYVHGDYDVDGLTSATLLTRFLQKIGCNVDVHVPHRMKEGYGIHSDAVVEAANAGAKLFLTCDCGSNAHEQIELAHERGMKVVVTDHHQFNDRIPDAEAVVNPHRPDSGYGFKDLSGVGVAFKLAAGIASELGINVDHFYRAYLDLAVLGTVADVMPLIGENRIIAKHGLERLRNTQKVGLKALLQVANLNPERPIKSGHIGFQLAPRLNAVGRIDDAAVALRLLLADDPADAWRLAQEVDRANTLRREEQDRIYEEALAQAHSLGVDDRFVVVVGAEGWHPGIVGIVAGRLSEELRRPAFVAGIDPETGHAKGSARTIPGFHLANAIDLHRPLFTSGGGHELAAGFSFDAQLLEEIRTKLDEHARTILSPEDLIVSLRADAEIDANELDLGQIAELEKLEPYGFGNPEPKFFSRNFRLCQATIIKDKHLFLDFETANNKAFRWKNWSKAEDRDQFPLGEPYDLIYSLGISTFQGMESIDFDVMGWRLAASSDSF